MKRESKLFSKENLFYCLAFLLPILLMSLVFWILGFYPFGQKTVISGDYIHQYIPIYRALGDIFTSFDFSAMYWSWSKGLGGSMASVHAFNGLSPITLVLGLVPMEYLNESIFTATLLRYGLAGLTFYYFLDKRYYASSNRLLALIVSLAYSMNGFLISNQVNPNFLDNIILLPLLMIGVEHILSGKRSLKYSLVLAGMIVVHFYTAYMSAIFVIIYSIYYLIRENDNNKMRSLFRLAGYSLLGVGVSAVFLLPVFYALLDTKVVSGEGEKWIFEWLYSPLVLLLKFFAGATGGIEEWADGKSGPNFYVSFLALLVTIKVFLSKNVNKSEKWANIFILITFLVIFSNAAGQKFMHMGQMPYGFYHRDAFILSFFFAFLVYRLLLKGLDWGRKSIFVILIAGLSYVLVYIASKQYTYTVVETWQYFYAIVLLFIFGVLVFIRLKSEMKLLFLLFLVMVDMVVNASVSIARTPTTGQDYVQTLASKNEETEMLNKLTSNLYRGEKATSVSLNDSMLFDYRGANHFTSSIEVATSKYFGNLGLSSSKNVFIYSSSTLLTDALVNMRYTYSDGYWQYTSLENMAALYNKTTNARILENPYTFGLAFSADKSIKYLKMLEGNPVENQNNIMKEIFDTNDDLFAKFPGLSLEYENFEPNKDRPRLFKKLDLSKSAKITIKFTSTDDNSYYMVAPKLHSQTLRGAKLSVNGKNFNVANRFDHAQLWNLATKVSGQQQTFEMEVGEASEVDFTDVEIYRFDNERFIKEFNEKHMTKWTPTEVESTRIEGNIKQVAGKNYMVTSIPYNSGWSVEVDGKEVVSDKVFDALLAFELPEGDHRIVLTFRHPGLLLGGIISLISLGIILYLAFYKNRKLINSEKVFSD